MIKFRHYSTSRFSATKHYGFCFEVHPKRKSLDIYLGGHVFVWFVGRTYGEL